MLTKVVLNMFMTNQFKFCDENIYVSLICCSETYFYGHSGPDYTEHLSLLRRNVEDDQSSVLHASESQFSVAGADLSCCCED